MGQVDGVFKNWPIVLIDATHAEHQGKELLPGSKQAFHAMLSEVSYKQWHSALGLSDLGCSMAQGSAEPPQAGMRSVQMTSFQISSLRYRLLSITYYRIARMMLTAISCHITTVVRSSIHGVCVGRYAWQGS